MKLNSIMNDSSMNNIGNRVVYLETLHEYTYARTHTYVSSSRPSYLEYEILQDAAFLFLA